MNFSDFYPLSGFDFPARLRSDGFILQRGKKDCGCDAKKEVDTIHCEGDVCHQTKDSLLIARTRDYWYSMLLKDPALYDKVTGYFTDDVELWAQSGLVVQGRAALSAAIRSNGIVLYNNYAVEDFETWVASDGGAVWVTMKRGETNLYTNVSGLVDYVARLDFTPEGNISAVHEFPNYEEVHNPPPLPVFSTPQFLPPPLPQITYLRNRCIHNGL